LESGPGAHAVGRADVHSRDRRALAVPFGCAIEAEAVESVLAMRAARLQPSSAVALVGSAVPLRLGSEGRLRPNRQERSETRP